MTGPIPFLEIHRHELASQLRYEPGFPLTFVEEVTQRVRSIPFADRERRLKEIRYSCQEAALFEYRHEKDTLWRKQAIDARAKYFEEFFLAMGTVAAGDLNQTFADLDEHMAALRAGR